MVCSGSKSVSLFLFKLLTCSNTRAKYCILWIHNFCFNDNITSLTLVLKSYLKDLVWPFSRKTFSTFGMGGTPDVSSPTLNDVDTCGHNRKLEYKNVYRYLFFFYVNRQTHKNDSYCGKKINTFS